MKRLLLAIALLILPAAGFAQVSAVPAAISYSGKVVDATGTPVGNTAAVNRTVTFRIWNHPSATVAANRLWSEAQSVTITGGEFSVLVGSGTAVSGETNAYTNFADVFDGNARYLGVTVDDGTSASDPEISPRQQIVTNPFAFRAKVAESVAAGVIGTAALANNAVGASTQIADGVVTSAKLASVDGAKIQSGTITLDRLTTEAAAALTAVNGANIGDDSIPAGKLKQNVITGGTTGNLALATITNDNLATGSVTTSQILDGTIATADLAGAVDGSGNVTTLGAVSTIKLQDSAVTLAKLATNSVDSSKIVDGSIVSADLAPNSVDGTKIAPNSVGLTQLDAVVRAGLPKTRVIYNQGVSTTITPNQYVTIPIDLGDLGNDADGCRMMIYAQNQGTPTSFHISEINFWLEQAGFAPDVNFPNIIRGNYLHKNGGGIAGNNFTLNPPALNNGALNFLQTQDYWVQLYNYYPGVYNSNVNNKAPAPYNTDQEPNASNANAGGPAVTFNVVSVVTGTNKLTITLNNPHAIQVGDYVEINGMSGNGIAAAMAASPRPAAVTTVNGVAYPPRNGAPGNLTGGLLVTAQNDRTSFEIALSGASGVYSGGTVKHQPVYNRFRIWAAVLPGVSARIILSDY